MKNNKIKIAAYAITRNESKNLPMWLDTVTKITDVIILADSASTDGTREMAQKFGAKVIDYEWQNDFAAARNFALSKIPRDVDWVVGLDADEFIVADEIPNVMASIESVHRNKSIMGISCRWINLDRDDNMRVKNAGSVMRVYRNSGDMRFTGAVHEMMMHGGRLIKENEIAFAKDFSIYHTGYSSEMMPIKLRRDLDIIISEQKRRGVLPQDAYYLADCYYGLGDYENTIAQARRAIDCGITMVGRDNRPHALLIQSLVALDRPMEEIEAAAKDAIKRHPGTGDFSVLAGIGAWSKKEYLLAEQYFGDGLSRYQKAEINPAVVDERVSLVPLACLYLARIKHMRGDDGAAMEYISEGIKANKYRTDLLRLAARILSSVPLADAVSYINAFYRIPDDAAWLVSALKDTRLSEAAIYYNRRVAVGERTISEYDMYMMAGKKNAAGAVAVDAGDSLLRMAAETMENGDDIGMLVPRLYKEAAANDAPRRTEIMARLADKARRFDNENCRKREDCHAR